MPPGWRSVQLILLILPLKNLQERLVYTEEKFVCSAKSSNKRCAIKMLERTVVFVYRLKSFKNGECFCTDWAIKVREVDKHCQY